MIPNIVKVNIKIGSVTISEKSFGVGLIVGDTGYSTGNANDRVREYTSIDSVAGDFNTTTPEYKAAESYFKQNPSPAKLLIGRKDAGDADIKETLDAIKASNDGFYTVAIVIAGVTDAELVEASEWVELQTRLMYVASSESNIIDEDDSTDTTSIWAQTKNNARTIILYSTHTDEYPEVAMMSKQISYKPGDYSMWLKQLNGISVDKLSDNQKANARAKKVNTYTTVGGADVIESGTTNKEWIDIINGMDWIQARIEERIFRTQLKSNKIEYTDGGVSILRGVVDSVLDEAQNVNNIISPDSYDENDNKVGGYTIDTKPVSEVPESEKQNREYKYLSFHGFLAGAIHYTEINGVLGY